MSTSDLVSLGFVVALSALAIGGAIWAGRRSKDPAALVRRIRERRWPIALTASGGAIALTGAAMVMHASLVPHAIVDLAAAERDGDVDAELATVEGYPRPEAIFCRGGSPTDDCYTPITSGPDSTTVAVLVADAVRTSDRGRFTGFVTRSNPRSFRLHLEELGFASIEEPVRLIPESRRERSQAGSVVALAGVALLAIGWVWLRRRSPRASQ